MNNTRILKVAIVASVLQLAGFQSFSQLQSPTWPISVLPIVEKPVFKADTFNIVKYGAINDGLTLNTKSINAAIEACSANGGGVVLVPAGLWSTGPVELKSNVNLHLKSDAVLSFSRDKSQYKLIEANWEGLAAVRNQPPISGTGLENVAITGKGIVDGNGDSWRMVKREKLTANQWEKLISSGGALDQSGKIWYPSASSLKGSQTNNAGAIAPGKTAKDYEDVKDFLRPNLLVLTKTKNIL